MAVIGATSQMQDPQDRRWFGNRKPRVYASIKSGPAPSPYGIDFLIWLQNNFDEVIEMNEQMKNCNHQWKAEYLVEDPLITRVRCHCGAIAPLAKVQNGA